MIASIIAKLLTVVARWPKKLIAPSCSNPPEFKELDVPALLGRLKMLNSHVLKSCWSINTKFLPVVNLNKKTLCAKIDGFMCH